MTADLCLCCGTCGGVLYLPRRTFIVGEREMGLAGRLCLMGRGWVWLLVYRPAFLSKHCVWSDPQFTSFQLVCIGPLEAETG